MILIKISLINFIKINCDTKLEIKFKFSFILKIYSYLYLDPVNLSLTERDHR